MGLGSWWHHPVDQEFASGEIIPFKCFFFVTPESGPSWTISDGDPEYKVHFTFHPVQLGQSTVIDSLSWGWLKGKC